MTIQSVLTISGDSSIAASVLSQSSASTFTLKWEQTTNPTADTEVDIYFYFGTQHIPNYFTQGLIVYIKRSCLGAPIDTVTISELATEIHYTIGFSGQLVIEYSKFFNVQDPNNLCSQAYDMFDMDFVLPEFITK